MLGALIEEARMARGKVARVEKVAKAEKEAREASLQVWVVLF